RSAGSGRAVVESAEAGSVGQVLDRLAGVADGLLDAALGLVGLAFGVEGSIVGDVAPGLLGLAFDFVELAFGLLFVRAVHDGGGVGEWSPMDRCAAPEGPASPDLRLSLIPPAGAVVVAAEAVGEASGDVVG